jgi:hypothetical protein
MFFISLRFIIQLPLNCDGIPGSDNLCLVKLLPKLCSFQVYESDTLCLLSVRKSSVNTQIAAQSVVSTAILISSLPLFKRFQLPTISYVLEEGEIIYSASRIVGQSISYHHAHMPLREAQHPIPMWLLLLWSCQRQRPMRSESGISRRGKYNTLSERGADD